MPTRCLLLPALLAILAQLSCSPAPILPPRITPIQTIQTVTANTRTTLQGTVIKRVPLVERGAYQLQDDTGTIWVLTTGELPDPGDRLTVEGEVVFQSIPVEGQELGETYLRELQRQPVPTEATP